MKFQLLLLFALVGTFSNIAHASTLVVPIKAENVTLPFQTDQPMTEEDISQAATSSMKRTTEAPLAGSKADTQPPPMTTEAPAETTEAAAGEARSVTTQTTDKATEAVDGAEPKTVSELMPEVKEESEVAQETTTDTKVMVVDQGMDSGHVVGIVIGALVVMAILIAVIIVVVRRMGHYSP